MNWTPLLILAALAGVLAVLWFIGLLRLSRPRPCLPPSPSDPSPPARPRPSFANLDLGNPAHRAVYDGLPWDRRRDIDFFVTELRNGSAVFCETCADIHLIFIQPGGTCVSMGACGAWTWPHPNWKNRTRIRTEVEL